MPDKDGARFPVTRAAWRRLQFAFWDCVSAIAESKKAKVGAQTLSDGDQ